jgi:hypothetical protein
MIIIITGKEVIIWRKALTLIIWVWFYSIEAFDFTAIFWVYIFWFYIQKDLIVINFCYCPAVTLFHFWLSNLTLYFYFIIIIILKYLFPLEISPQIESIFFFFFFFFFLKDSKYLFKTLKHRQRMFEQKNIASSYFLLLCIALTYFLEADCVHSL